MINLAGLRCILPYDGSKQNSYNPIHHCHARDKVELFCPYTDHHIHPTIVTMDHTINNLDACIYDYLAYHSGNPKTLPQIYSDITSPVGHRCTDLNTPALKYEYKNKFITICYQMDTLFNDIHKIFRDDKLLLVYSKKSHDEVIKQYTPELYAYSGIELDTDMNNDPLNCLVMDAVSQNKYPTITFEDSNTILHEIAKHNAILEFDMLANKFELDILVLNRYGKSPIDLAEEHNHAQMVRRMVEYMYCIELLHIRTRLYDAEQNNIILTERNTLLTTHNRELQSNLMTGWPSISMIFFYVFFVLFVAYLL